MGGKNVKGFGGNAGSQEIPRQMAIAKQIGQPVSEYTGPVSTSVTFYKMDLAYHTEDEGPVAHRPYLEFAGKIRRMQPIQGMKLPGDVTTVVFDMANAPVIRGRWELSNSEIAELADKGLFGGNAQVMPKGLRPTFDDPENPFYEEKSVRGNIQMPHIFTEVPFDDVPVECLCQCMTVDINGRGVPVFVAVPTGRTAGQDGIILSSAATGYGSMAQYFREIEYYEHGDPSERREFVQVSDWLENEADKGRENEQAIIDAMAAKVNEARTAIRGPKVLTPMEDKERQELADLRFNIDARVKQAQVEGPGGLIDQALTYEDQAAEQGERLLEAAQETPQEASGEPQDGREDGQGIEYLEPDGEQPDGQENENGGLPDGEPADYERQRQAAARDAVLDQQQDAVDAGERIRRAQEKGEQVAGREAGGYQFGDD